MTKFNFSFWTLLSVLLLAQACEDPSTVGSEVIGDGLSNIQYTDTVTVNAKTISQDRIFTYTDSIPNQPGNYLVGSISEPTFGRSKAELYVDFILNATSQGTSIKFLDGTAQFDSLVLSLAYNGARTYGDTLIPRTLEVYEITEVMDEDEEYYYSDRTFATNPEPVGSMDFLPRPNSLVTFISSDDTTTTAPQISIRLDDAFGMRLMSYDSAAYSTADMFQEVFKGLKITTGGEDDAGILGFDLKSSLTKLELYYTDSEGEALSLRFLIGAESVKFNAFEHDYTGAMVEPYINDEDSGADLLFFQGMSGTKVELDFPYLNALWQQNAIINKAELEFTVAHQPGDDTLHYFSAPQVGLTYLAENDNYYAIDDLRSAIALLGTGAVSNLEPFGGALADSEDGVKPRTYTVNISDQLQDLMECTTEEGYTVGCIDRGEFSPVNGKMYLDTYLKGQFPYRSILYGPGDPLYSPKLKLTYTLP